MTTRKRRAGIVHEQWHLPDLRRPVDLGKLGVPGTYPDVEEKAAFDLARAIHTSESDGCVVTWSAQERAHAYINAHGLAAALDEITRLEGKRR